MFPAPTFWTHTFVVHPEVIVLSFAVKMLTNCAWTPRFQSVAVPPAQGPFFSLPLFHCDETCWRIFESLSTCSNCIKQVGKSQGYPGCDLGLRATIETRQSRSWYLQGSTPWHLPLEMRRIALGGQNRQKRASWTGWTGWTGWNNRNR